MQIFHRFVNQDKNNVKFHQETHIIDEDDANELDALQGDTALIIRAAELHNLKDTIKHN